LTVTGDDLKPAKPMIGLVGGLGVGAAIHYYRELAAAHHARRRVMHLAMVNASISRATEYASQGDRHGLALYLAGFLSRLHAAGATLGVVPAVTPHLCIDELTAIAPIPMLDITRIVAETIRARGLSRVAVFGTRFVIESNLYGRLNGIEVVRLRESELSFVHEAYSQLAHTATVSAEHRQQLVALAGTLVTRDRVEAVVLAGTDFALMFDGGNTPFPHVDCARAHVDAIMRAIEA
jgi:aspartate racemase